MAAFDFGALLSGATQGLAGFRRGQMQGEDVHRQREEAERVQLFNEFAKRQQLQQQAEATQGLNEYRAGQVDIKDRLASLAQKVAEQGSWKDQSQYGTGGTVDRTIAGQDRRNDANNAVRVQVEQMPARPHNEEWRWLRGGATRGSGGSRGNVLASQQRDLNEIRDFKAQIKVARDAVDKAIEKKADFVGPIDKRWNALMTAAGKPNMVANEAERAWSRLVSPLINKSFGAALSQREEARINAWLPKLESSDENVVRNTLREMEAEFERMWQDRLEMLEANGQDASGFRRLDSTPGGPGPAPAPAAPASDPNAPVPLWRTKKPVPR